MHAVFTLARRATARQHFDLRVSADEGTILRLDGQKMVRDDAGDLQYGARISGTLDPETGVVTPGSGPATFTSASGSPVSLSDLLASALRRHPRLLQEIRPRGAPGAPASQTPRRPARA